MMRSAHKIRSPRDERPVGKGPISLLLIHASELLTLRGPNGPRTGPSAGELGIVEDGALYSEHGRIVAIGPSSEIRRDHPTADVEIDATGRVVLPGFVDPHTHAIFAGFREREVEWKAAGLGYADIAARGGGILHTVQATREATEETLSRLGAERLHTLLKFGTTTAEVKSGYGLRTADEVKMLRAAGRAADASGVEVVRTFLGAHTIPPEFGERREAYLELVAGEMLETVATERLASACDVFIDAGYFSTDDGRRLLRKARSLGFAGKVHADELGDSGGAALAAEARALSADHLIHASSDGIEALARAGTVAVLLPAASLSTRMPFADGRRLVAAGVPVALGTDFNPNCWCESMQLVIALACHHNGLLPAQAIVAATINAACAVGVQDEVGSLEPGKLADLLVLDAPSWRHLGYRFGGNAVETVVKRGHVVHDTRLTK